LTCIRAQYRTKRRIVEDRVDRGSGSRRVADLDDDAGCFVSFASDIAKPGRVADDERQRCRKRLDRRHGKAFAARGKDVNVSR